MAESNTPAPGNAAQSSTRVETVRSTVDVLDAKGNDMNSGDSPLADIFAKIEQGSSAKDAIKDVMEKPAAPKETPAPDEGNGEESTPAQKEIPKEEPKAAPQDETDFFKSEKEREDEAAKAKSAEDERKAADDKKVADEVPTEEELTVLPHDKPKTAKRIKALLTKIDQANNLVTETKKEAEAKAAKLAELEAELTKVKSVDPTQNEAIKAQLDELKMYRRRYDLEKDPEVAKKFTSRIVDAEAAIKSTLIKRSAGDTLIKIIEDEGGWLQFSESDRDITMADGNTMKAAELADVIKKALPLGDRRLVESLEIEQVSTKREKERYFQEQVKEATQYFERLENDRKQQTEQQARVVEEGKNIINSWRKKVFEETEWMKLKEVPSNATPEQKAAIEDENKYTKQLHGLVDKAISANKLDDMLEVVMDSVRYHQERRQAARLIDEKKALEKQVADTKAELERFKKAGSSVPRNGSLVGGGAGAATPKAAQKPESLEDALEAISSGRSPNGDE